MNIYFDPLISSNHLNITEKVRPCNHLVNIDATRLEKFSPRPRGKSVIGKISFEYMIKVAKVFLF